MAIKIDGNILGIRWEDGWCGSITNNRDSLAVLDIIVCAGEGIICAAVWELEIIFVIFEPTILFDWISEVDDHARSAIRNCFNDSWIIYIGASALQNTVIEVYVTAVNAIYAALNFWGSRVDMAFAICIDAVVEWIFVLAESDVGGEIRDAMDTVSITIDCSACNIDILCTDTGTNLAGSIGNGRDGAASHGDVAILPII